LGELFEDLAGDVAFQAAHDLSGVQPFVSAARYIGAGFGVAGHAGQHDAVERSVGVTVAAPVQSIPGRLSG
jgi:hypothetical protein